MTFPWSPPPTPTPHPKSRLFDLFRSLHFSVTKLVVRFCVGLHSPSTSRQWLSSFRRNFLGCRFSACAHVKKTPVHAPQTRSVVEVAIYLWAHTQSQACVLLLFLWLSLMIPTFGPHRHGAWNLSSRCSSTLSMLFDRDCDARWQLTIHPMNKYSVLLLSGEQG